VARSWYLGGGGRLLDKPGGRAAYERFTATPHSGPDADYLGANGTGTGTGGLWGNSSQWTWNWRSRKPGTAVSYLTAPLRSSTTVLGAGALYAWIRSSKPTEDLMATITEVRPDGKETYVQSGYVRTNERALATASNSLMKQPSTLLAPILSLRKADVKAMPKGRFVKEAIPLY
jgi:predicted acyl esterase